MRFPFSSFEIALEYVKARPVNETVHIWRSEDGSYTALRSAPTDAAAEKIATVTPQGLVVRGAPVGPLCRCGERTYTGSWFARSIRRGGCPDGAASIVLRHLDGSPVGLHADTEGEL